MLSSGGSSSRQGRISAQQLRARARHMGSKALGRRSLPGSLHLRRCLPVLSSALWSGILVPSPLSQAKDRQLAVHPVPKYSCSCGSGAGPRPPLWQWRVRGWRGAGQRGGVSELPASCVPLARQDDSEHQWVQRSPPCALLAARTACDRGFPS